MHGQDHLELSASDSDAIRNEFNWGVDLFNFGFYWEAHEAWEGVWNAFGRTGSRAGFVKGLIKLAAAGVKALEGNARGVERHRNRAIELLNEAHESKTIDWRLEFGVSPARLVGLVPQSEIMARTETQSNQGCVMPFVIIDESKCTHDGREPHAQ